MSSRAAAAWLAGLVIVAALIAGLVPVSANDVACGSALGGGSSSEAETAQITADFGEAIGGATSGTDYAADCADRRGTQRMFVIPLLIVGVLAGGFLALTAKRDEVTPAPDRQASQ